MSTHINVPIQLNGGVSPINDKGEVLFQLFDREPYIFNNGEYAYLYVGVQPTADEMNDIPSSKPVPIYTHFADRAKIVEKSGIFSLIGDNNSETHSHIGNFNIHSGGLQGSNEKVPTISDFKVTGLKKLVIDMTGVDTNTSQICGTNPDVVANPEVGQIFFKIVKDVI